MVGHPAQWDSGQCMDAYIGRRRESIPDDESADCAGAMGGSRGRTAPKNIGFQEAP